MDRDMLYFRHVLFVFLGALRFRDSPQNEVRVCSRRQSTCSTEIPPPLMRSRGKKKILRARGEVRGLGLILCVQPPTKTSVGEYLWIAGLAARGLFTMDWET